MSGNFIKLTQLDTTVYINAIHFYYPHITSTTLQQIQHKSRKLSRTSLSHRGQTASLLPDDSTAAQEACNYHQAASQDEDISRDSKSAGCQQT